MDNQYTNNFQNISPPLWGGREGLLIKVCGLREPKNILEVARLEPDMMGFIFYHNSPRFAKHLDVNVLHQIPKHIKKVGVFVNEDLENILTYIEKYKLDAVQLHGAENYTLCKKLKDESKVMIIKVFSVMSADNFKVTKEYEPVSDYFLFDTKTDVYGGSGQKFNWNILNEYKGNKEFILSGGISLSDVKPICKIFHPKLIGVDLNSKFEIKPGLKDVEKLRMFIHEFRNTPKNRIVEQN
ncbi:N-(5'-phosphoribosyl)anthranilate isomerase [uncultured Paludibacter sp.]|nr:N-(5'-phosphoribosyl)anthranilate isomerase [uncultured Paludibacter sp.]